MGVNVLVRLYVPSQLASLSRLCAQRQLVALYTQRRSVGFDALLSAVAKAVLRSYSYSTSVRSVSMAVVNRHMAVDFTG